MYILTMVNEEGYTNGKVFASMNLENVLDVMKGMIIEQYQGDRELIEGLLDQFYTIDARAEVRRKLEEDKYYSLSGPDETPFEIAAMDNEQDVVDFYRQAEPRNNHNNANNFNENENRRYWNRRREEMNENDYVRYEAERMMGGKRKVRKTRKAKKSKKSKMTRRH